MMEHEHDYIILSGPWPLKSETEDQRVRPRYVVDCACIVCGTPRRQSFLYVGLRSVPRMARLLERHTGVRFATSAELADYHKRRSNTRTITGQ